MAKKWPNGYEPTTFFSRLCPHCEEFLVSARTEKALLDGLLEHVDAKHPEEAGKTEASIQ